MVKMVFLLRVLLNHDLGYLKRLIRNDLHLLDYGMILGYF